MKNSDKSQTIRLEYGIYFLRQNGQYSKKVFKINERIYKAGEIAEIKKHQSFRIITQESIIWENKKFRSFLTV